jgi:hypothetical protein
MVAMINANARDIAELRRQLRALRTELDSLGRKVTANRQATSTIATQSGIRIEFADDDN